MQGFRGEPSTLGAPLATKEMLNSPQHRQRCWQRRVKRSCFCPCAHGSFSWARLESRSIYIWSQYIGPHRGSHMGPIWDPLCDLKWSPNGNPIGGPMMYFILYYHYYILQNQKKCNTMIFVYVFVCFDNNPLASNSKCLHISFKSSIVKEFLALNEYLSNGILGAICCHTTPCSDKPGNRR